MAAAIGVVRSARWPVRTDGEGTNPQRSALTMQMGHTCLLGSCIRIISSSFRTDSSDATWKCMRIPFGARLWAAYKPTITSSGGRRSIHTAYLPGSSAKGHAACIPRLRMGRIAIVDDSEDATFTNGADFLKNFPGGKFDLVANSPTVGKRRGSPR